MACKPERCTSCHGRCKHLRLLVSSHGGSRGVAAPGGCAAARSNHTSNSRRCKPLPTPLLPCFGGTISECSSSVSSASCHAEQESFRIALPWRPAPPRPAGKASIPILPLSHPTFVCSAGFLLGSRQTLLETFDGGKTWEPRTVQAAQVGAAQTHVGAAPVTRGCCARGPPGLAWARFPPGPPPRHP